LLALETFAQHPDVITISLTLTTPGAQPRTLELSEDTWIIGSGSASDILSIEVPGVAFRHCKITLREHSLLVEDLDSPTGTFVNGTQISGSTEMAYPVTLRMGAAELKLEYPSPAPTSGSESERTSKLTQPRQTHPESAHQSDKTACLTAAELNESTMAFAMTTEEVPIDDNVSVQMQYALKSEIARGGMGKIFTATDPHLAREVALKVSTVNDRAEDTHFLREARVLANLAHPNIVPIHHIGTDSQGRPFYSMKLVNGRTLQAIIKLLDAGDSDTIATYTLQRLMEIFRKICDAVSFAHAKGYLHRDLKPENVMIGEFGEVLVMDWGLAKVFRRTSTPAEHGADDEPGPETVPYIEGTPKYMSPEQAEGMFRGLDQRSDIYSLGGILYAILMHRAPVSGSDLQQILKKVKKGETTTMTLPRRGNPKDTTYKPSHVNESLPEALKAITKMALARHRKDRYQTVDELIADIEAYQRGYATTAEHATLFVQLQLLVKRNPAVSAMVAVLLITAAVFTMRLAASEREAMAQARRADEQALLARTNEQEAQAQAKRAHENEQKAQAERQSARQEAAKVNIALAETADQNSDAEQIRIALESVGSEFQNQAWRYLSGKIASATSHIQFPSGDNLIADSAFVPNEEGKLISISRKGSVLKHDLITGGTQTVMRGFKTQEEVLITAISPDGKILARGLKPNASGRTSPEHPSYFTDLIRLDSGTIIARVRTDETLLMGLGGKRPRLIFSPDSSLILVLGPNQGLQMLDASTGTVLWTLKITSPLTAGFSKLDGSLKVVSSAPAEILSLDPRTGGTVAESIKLNDKVTDRKILQITADSAFTALFYLTKNTLFKADARSGAIIYQTNLPRENSISVQYIDALQLILTLTPISEQSATVCVWDGQSGVLVKSIPVEIPRDDYREWKLDSDPNQRQFALSRSSTLKTWTLNRPSETASFPIPNPASTGFTFLGSPNKIVRQAVPVKNKNGQNSAEVVSTNLETQISEPLELFKKLTNNSTLYLSSNRDGTRIASGIAAMGSKPTLSMVASEGAVLTRISEGISINPLPYHFALNPGGDTLWLGTSVCEPVTGRQITKVDREANGIPPQRIENTVPRWLNQNQVLEVALVSPSPGATYRLLRRMIIKWNALDGSCEKTPAPLASNISPSPSGKQFAEAGTDRRVRIRNAVTFEIERELRVHDEELTDVAWHPKLNVLATASKDDTVKIWDLNTENMLEEFGLFHNAPNYLEWSPEGTRLAVKTTGDKVYFLAPKLRDKDSH
jgi:serine/threonine protein kinase